MHASLAWCVSCSDQTGPTDDGCIDMHVHTQARKLRDPITSQSGSIAFPEKGLSLRGADRSEIRTRQSGLSIFAFLSMCTNTTPYGLCITSIASCSRPVGRISSQLPDYQPGTLIWTRCFV